MSRARGVVDLGGGSGRARWLVPAGLMAVTALAGLARLLWLGSIPPGLHYDEAFNGLDAYGILAGNRPIFFESNFGREPLYMYLEAALFLLLPATPALMRSIAATAGTLAVPLTFGAARELFPGKRYLPWFAALTQAFLPWDLHFSRYGLRIEFLVLFGSATVYLLVRGWRRASLATFALSGLMLGLSLYGYIAARLLPLVILAWVALALARAERPDRGRLAVGVAVLAIVAALVFAPLGWYFLHHHASFTYRAGQVAVGGGVTAVARQLANNAWLWVKAFAVSGDANPRNNLPGAPALTPWLLLPFALGTLYSLRRGRDPAHGFVLAWLGIMLVPSIASDYAPSFQRAIGAVPPLAVLTAIGLSLLADVVGRFSRRPHLGIALAAVLLIGQTAIGLHQYFIAWGRSNAVYYAFDEGIYRIGLYMRERSLAGEWVYLSPVRPDHATLHFVMHDVGGPVTFDGRKVFVIAPRDGKPVEYIFLIGEDSNGPRLARDWYPRASTAAIFEDHSGQEYGVALRAQSHEAQPVLPEVETHVRWENGIFLDGLDMSRDGPYSRSGTVRAYWSTDTPVSLDYTWFVHLIGPPNAATNSQLWAGADGMPGQGTYRTSAWRRGETIIEERELTGPDNLISGQYYLEFGWYRLETGERLQLTGPSSAGDRELLGPFHVEVSAGGVTVRGS